MTRPRTPRQHLRHPLTRLRYYVLIGRTVLEYGVLKLRRRLRA